MILLEVCLTSVEQINSLLAHTKVVVFYKENVAFSSESQSATAGLTPVQRGRFPECVFSRHVNHLLYFFTSPP